jgi:hypothetical protein
LDSVYRESLSLRELEQLFSADLTVPRDLAEQPGPDSFTRMHWYYRAPAIRMAKEMVAAANARDHETHPAQGI